MMHKFIILTLQLMIFFARLENVIMIINETLWLCIKIAKRLTCKESNKH